MRSINKRSQVDSAKKALPYASAHLLFLWFIIRILHSDPTQAAWSRFTIKSHTWVMMCWHTRPLYCSTICTHLNFHSGSSHFDDVTYVRATHWLKIDCIGFGQIMPIMVTSQVTHTYTQTPQLWLRCVTLQNDKDGCMNTARASFSLIKWNLDALWGCVQVRATCFSGYFSDSVPAAACSAAVKWKEHLRGGCTADIYRRK